MANIWEKTISILAGNLISGLITIVIKKLFPINLNYNFQIRTNLIVTNLGNKLASADVGKGPMLIGRSRQNVISSSVQTQS